MATRLIGDFLDLYILKLLEVQNMCVGEILESVKCVNKMNNAKSRIVIKKATLYSHINKLKKENIYCFSSVDINEINISIAKKAKIANNNLLGFNTIKSARYSPIKTPNKGNTK